MKTETKIRLTILVLMMVVNTIAQNFETQLAAYHYESWIVFMSNIMFFAIIDDNLKRKFISTLTGSVVGLVQAYVLILVRSFLAGIGINALLATILPLGIILSCNILLTHKLPYICNNVTLTYFNVALINAEELYMNFIPYLLWCIGEFVVMTGLCVIAMIYFMKQAKRGVQNV